MADTISTVEQTPEAVAYRLMHYIISTEGKKVDRETILSTYAECLLTVKCDIPAQGDTIKDKWYRHEQAKKKAA